MAVAIRANFGLTQQVAEKNTEKKNNQAMKMSFQANGLLQNNGIEDRIAAKKNQARQQALKLVTNAWASDTKAADDVQEMESIKKDKVSELNEIHAKMKNIDSTKKSLQEEYGVASDSKEQKDLELLEKYQNNKNGFSYDSFSEEELERLKELQNEPLTEYQQKVLNLNNMKGQISFDADKKQSEIAALTASVSDASLEQLKSQGMLNAADAAEEVMDAANKEIFAMLIEEGKETIDKKLEEEQEKAEETAEKKEEKEEQIEEAKENRKEQEEIIEGQQETNKLEQDILMYKQSVSAASETQKNLQKILKENNLINEDLKGIEIDLNF